MSKLSIEASPRDAATAEVSYLETYLETNAQEARGACTKKQGNSVYVVARPALEKASVSIFVFSQRPPRCFGIHLMWSRIHASCELGTEGVIDGQSIAIKRNNSARGAAGTGARLSDFDAEVRGFAVCVYCSGTSQIPTWRPSGRPFGRPFKRIDRSI
jgi:hypothetical protein